MPSPHYFMFLTDAKGEIRLTLKELLSLLRKYLEAKDIFIFSEAKIIVFISLTLKEIEVRISAGFLRHCNQRSER